jgi:hypothetical protein
MTIVYDNQNYWLSGFYPSSRTLNAIKQRFENWICFRPQVRGGKLLYSCVP